MSALTFPDLQELLVRSVDLSPVSISVADITAPDRGLVFVNEAFEKLTGYERDDIIGKNCRFLQGDDTDTETVERIRQGIDAGMEVRETLLNYRKDGSPFWNDLKLVPVKDDHDPASPVVAYIGIQQDISALRLDEIAIRQKQKLQSIGQLSGSISHEINNMLHPILSLSKRLRKELDLNERQLEMLETIIDCATRSEEILQGVLAFSRDQEKNLEAMEIQQAIDVAFQTVAATLPPMVKINYSCHGLEAHRALISQTQMTQVLTNLISNAIYANCSKGVIDFDVKIIHINLSSPWHRLVPSGLYASFSVTDRGPGINRNSKDLIFDPFFTTKPVGEGTGLGLSVIWGILRDWRGGIKAENIEGKGARFEFVVPLLPQKGSKHG